MPTPILATKLYIPPPRPKAVIRTRLLDRDSFTARERDVLDLLAEGASNRQIARRLDLSLKTVQNHVSHILDKLQAADRTQVVLRARGIPPVGG